MDEDFIERLHAAALRARASGFEGVAEAIEEILKRELEKLEDAEVFEAKDGGRSSVNGCDS